MNTYLGRVPKYSAPPTSTAPTVEASSYVYLEGICRGSQPGEGGLPQRRRHRPRGREQGCAHAVGRLFCVDRYRDEFLELMRSGTLDILFADNAELKSLYQTADFATALAALRRDENDGNGQDLGVVTRSEEGCLVVSHDETVAVPAFPIDELVDTTGAGDLFAADSCLAFPVISMPPPAPATARSLPPRSSSTSARVPP